MGEIMRLSLSKFFQARCNVRIFRHLPPVFCYEYVQVLGKIYYRIFKQKERRIIERNVREVTQCRTEKEMQKRIKETFRGIYAHYFEKMFSAYRSFEEVKKYVDQRFTFKGEQVLNEALAQNKGVILVTAHFGAVEFIPWVLGLKGYPISVILECATDELMVCLEEKARNCDAELIRGDDDRSVFFRALQSIKENRILMTECDEVDKWRRRKAQTIELFGKTLYFDNTLDVLSRRTGAPAVGVFLKRTGHRSYQLECERVDVEAGGRVARSVLGMWERYVSEYPEQWYQWKKWEAMKAVS